MRSGLALWLTLAAVALAILPASWVLAREGLRRVSSRRALRRVEQARQLVSGQPPEDVTALAKALAARFDALTVDRAVVELLRSADPASRAWGTRLFAELGLVDRYARLVRAAARWSERTFAAEILGLAEVPAAVPALVQVLRDPHEDEVSVKAAAARALASLHDVSAIPLLVHELREADDRAAHEIAEALTAFGSAGVEAVAGLLSDAAHPSARVWAARILGRIGDPGAVDELVVRLHDRDDRLRMAVAEALGVIGDKRALHAVVRAALRDPAPQVRAHAAGAVGRIEGERAVDVLIAALGDPDHATRLRALEAFETMQIEDTSPLEAALRDANVEVRRRAALALERVGYLDRLLARLCAEDGDVRARAYEALLEMGRAGLVDSVTSCLRHAAFEVRAVAARACGDLGAARAGPPLLSAAVDVAWPVRAAACVALGQIGYDEAAGVLVAALGDPEEVVREAAAEAISRLNPARFVDQVASLAAAYDVGTVAVRTSVVAVAGRVAEASAQALLARASVDPSDRVRLAAVTALGQATDGVRIEALVTRLTDASLDVRMAAVAALGSSDRVEAFEGLLRALPGAERAIRDEIAQALARGAKQRLFERLPELERQATSDVRLGIAWTLGKIGDAEGIPALARFLRDRDATLRASAAGALSKIAHPAACDALLAAAEDPDGRVRAAVVNALGRIGGGHAGVRDALQMRARDPDAFVRTRAVIALARIAAAPGEDRQALHAKLAANLEGVDPAGRLVALALLGTESALTSVLDAIADGRFDAVLAFLEKEERSVRAAFFAALKLEDPAASGRRAEPVEIVGQYERTLRTSLDVAARRLAVAAVERMGAGHAVPALVDAATGDPNESVRLRAAQALSTRADDDSARRGLVRAVGDPNSDVAIVAARAIARRRDAEAIAALKRRLGAGSDKVEEVVEAALADMYREDPTAFIDWMMGVDAPERMTPAIRVLARTANQAALPLLRHLLGSRAPTVRAGALRAITQIDRVEAAAVVESMAQDPSEDVRMAVVDAVVWMADALIRLAPLRRDPSVRVREHLARALGRRHEGAPPKAVHRVLEGMVADASPAVRAAALVSLAASVDPEGVRAFALHWPVAAPDTRVAVRADPRAAEVRAALGSRLSASNDPVERKAAVTAVGALATASSASVELLGALRDPAPAVRIAAIQALATVDDEHVRASIAELCADPEASVQEAARRGLLQSAG